MVLYFLEPLLFSYSSVTRCSLSFPVSVLLNAPLCHSFLGSLCGCFMLRMFTLVGHGLHLRYCGGAFSVGVLRYALSPFVLWFNQSNVLFFSSQSWIRIHGSIHAFQYFMLCLIVDYCQISLVTVPLQGHFPTVADCRIFALFLFLKFHTEMVVAWMWNVLCRLMCWKAVEPLGSGSREWALWFHTLTSLPFSVAVSLLMFLCHYFMSRCPVLTLVGCIPWTRSQKSGFLLFSCFWFVVFCCLIFGHSSEKSSAVLKWCCLRCCSYSLGSRLLHFIVEVGVFQL